MSRSIKTRELYFQSLNSSNVANNTTGSWSPIVINIPETDPVFRNVIAEVYIDDYAGTAAAITKRALTFNLGTSASIHINNTSTVNNTGEAISFQHSYDLTNYFTSSWSGTNMGASASFVFSGTTAGSSNYGLRLCMTYEYNTNSATQSKTVFIPIGSKYTFLPSTKTLLGQIPALTTFLPETDIVINQINFIFENNKNNNSTTDDTIFMEIGSSGSHSPLFYENQTGVTRLHKYIWSNRNFTTSSIQDFFLWSPQQYHTNHSIYMSVDYNYNPSSSQILNSVRIPFQFENQYNIAISQDNYIRQKINYLVNEPGNIIPTTSSVIIYNTRGNLTTSWWFRTQTGSSFINVGSQTTTTVAGNFTTMFTSSNGFNIRKGRNELYFDFYKGSSVSSGGGLSGLIFLNYYSGNGDVNRHNKTIVNNFFTVGIGGANSGSITTRWDLWMPESSSFYHLNTIGDEYNLISATANHQYNLFYSKSLGEIGEEKQNTLDTTLYDGIEVGNRKFYTSTDNIFKKTNLDILRNLHPTQSRNVTIINAQGSTVQTPTCATYYTYNSLYEQVSGSISNTSGGTVNLGLFREYDNREIMTQTVTGNVNYSFKVPDSEDIYFVVANSGSLSRVSSHLYPSSGSYDIDFAMVVSNYETFF